VLPVDAALPEDAELRSALPAALRRATGGP